MSDGSLLAPVLREFASAWPAEDVLAIEKAYRVADEFHCGQFRNSGDPYVTHAVAVADLVARQGARKEVVCAALLHDVGHPADWLRQEFGAEIANLVTDLGALERHGVVTAVSADVLLLKLADRLHNLRTIEFVAPDKQRVKSAQTLRLLVPLAARLGLVAIGAELAALSWSVLKRPAPGAPDASRLLAWAAVLLPREVRARWLAEWAGELASLPARRDRVRFAAQLVVGMPRMASALRRSGREPSGREPSGREPRGRAATSVLAGGACAATLLSANFSWPAAVTALGALALLAAVLFARTDVALRRLLRLFRSWRR